MKLDIIRESIPSFVQSLRSREGSLHLYKYQVLENFRQTWTFGTDNFAHMYDRSLQSDVTKRWWKREQYRPKEVMLLLIGNEEQYVREAFKELYNTSKQIENRIDRFVYYCDELLRMYKRANPKSIENNHYQDSAMISLYLAGMSPDEYTLYPGRDIFNKALRTLGAKESPEKDDLPRFFKVSKIIYQYMMKDQDVLAVIEQGARPADNLLIVHEFLFNLAGVTDRTTAS